MLAVGSAGPSTAAVESLIADPSGLRVVFQPIVDLARGVAVGYEALSRFPAGAPPEWLDAARAAGRLGELEAVMLRGQLAARGALPPDCFLSVNLSPDALASAAVQEVFAEQASLAATVLEVTEQARVEDYGALLNDLAPARALGALLAIDDAGAGYASLAHITNLRPDFVKLDRGLVDGCDADPVKRAALEMLGVLAGRIDAWVIAEGIERREELDALLALDIPLAQGFHLGRPAPEMTPVPAELTDWLSRMSAWRQTSETVVGLVEAVHTESVESVPDAAIAFLVDPRLETIVLVDAQGRPVRLCQRTGDGAPRAVTVISADDKPGEVLRRALTRPQEVRFDPLVCRDSRGRCAGLVTVERLVGALLR